MNTVVNRALDLRALESLTLTILFVLFVKNTLMKNAFVPAGGWILFALAILGVSRLLAPKRKGREMKKPAIKRVPAALILLAFVAYFGAALAGNLATRFMGNDIGLAQLFPAEPKYCMYSWHGNMSKSGAVFPAFLTIFHIIFGPGFNSLRIAHAAISVITAFLLYLTAKKIYGCRAAFLVLLLLMAQSTVSGTAGGIDIEDLMAQNACSVAFLLLLLCWSEERKLLVSAALGLVAGLGFANKVFFLVFLAAALSAVLIRRHLSRKNPSSGTLDCRTCAAFALVFLIAASPFILFNVINGFPTVDYVIIQFDTARYYAVYQHSYQQYRFWDFPANLLTRIDHLYHLGVAEGWGQTFLALAVMSSLHLFAFPRKGSEDRKFIFLLGAVLLAFSTLSYHELVTVEMNATKGIFFLIYAYPLAVFATSGERRSWVAAVPLLILIALAAVKTTNTVASLGSAPPPLKNLVASQGMREVYVHSCPSAYIARFALPSEVPLERVSSVDDYRRILSDAESGPFLFVLETPRMADLGAPWGGWEGNLSALRQTAVEENVSIHQLEDYDEEQMMEAFVVSAPSP